MRKLKKVTIDAPILSCYTISKAIEFLTIWPKGILLDRRVSEGKSCFLNFNIFNKQGKGTSMVTEGKPASLLQKKGEPVCERARGKM